MGIYPEPFLDVIHASVANLIQNYEARAQGVERTTRGGGGEMTGALPDLDPHPAGARPVVCGAMVLLMLRRVPRRESAALTTP